jgi:SAM-dependent methyltransferase
VHAPDALLAARQGIGRAFRAGTAAVTSGGTQDFLGASWVERSLRWVPARHREAMALRLVGLSPHYFYDRDRRAEAARNRSSRSALAQDLVLPRVDAGTRVLDYGCGPGYLAAAVAPYVDRVEAVDISRGVLACARVLNGAENIRYERPDEADHQSEQVDIAYSFAVAQHLTDETFRSAMALLRRRLRPGGTLLVHFPLSDDRWHTEDDWTADTSVKGRAKLRFGLNCFGRSRDQVISIATEAGFKDPHIQELNTMTSADPDISRQCLLVATA